MSLFSGQCRLSFSKLKTLVCLIAAVLAVGCAPRGSQPPVTQHFVPSSFEHWSRTIALTKAFHAFCLEKLPTFDTVAAKAAELHLDQINDDPNHNGIGHAATWRVHDFTGDFDVEVFDTRRAKNCSVLAPDYDYEELRSALSSDPMLGTPDDPEHAYVRFDPSVQAEWTFRFEDQLTWVRIYRSTGVGSQKEIWLLWKPGL